MSTDLTTPAEGVIVHPATSETINPRELNGNDLAQLLEDVRTMSAMVYEFRDALVAEVCRRADMTGQRTIELHGCKFEVNAPTEDVYEPEHVRAQLEPLVESGVIDQSMIDHLIVRPEPKPPAERVDKRRLNAILKTDDRELLHALSLARVRVVNRRTAKLIERPTEATAEEVNG